MPKQSECPEGNDDWEESEEVCPDCGKLVWWSRWWDDHPDNGGACIGTKLECGDCGWVD